MNAHSVKRILVSQPDPPNPLKNSGFCIQNAETGTQPGQIYEIQTVSLHDAILELCKEKKCVSSNRFRTFTTYLQNSTIPEKSGISPIMSSTLQQGNLKGCESRSITLPLSGAAVKWRKK